MGKNFSKLFSFDRFLAIFATALSCLSLYMSWLNRNQSYDIVQYQVRLEACERMIEAQQNSLTAIVKLAVAVRLFREEEKITKAEVLESLDDALDKQTKMYEAKNQNAPKLPQQVAGIIEETKTQLGSAMLLARSGIFEGQNYVEYADVKAQFEAANDSLAKLAAACSYKDILTEDMIN